MRKKRQEDKTNIKEKAVRMLEFPEELVLPRIVFSGNKRVTVENYKAIIEYETDSIRISTACFLLQMKGKQFEIQTISDDGLQITGVVTQVEFIY